MLYLVYVLFSVTCICLVLCLWQIGTLCRLPDKQATAEGRAELEAYHNATGWRKLVKLALI